MGSRHPRLATNELGVVNYSQYNRVKHAVWYESLAKRWYEYKCSTYDLDSITFKFVDPESGYNELLGTLDRRLRGLRGDVTVEHILSEAEVYDIIQRVAAHFGEPSAILSHDRFAYVANPQGSPVDENINAIFRENRRVHPWTKYWSDASDLKMYGLFSINREHPSMVLMSNKKESIQTNSDGRITAEKLMNFDPNIQIEYEYHEDRQYSQLIDRTIDGLLVLDESGIVYDLPALVDHLCRRLPKYWKDEQKFDTKFSCQDVVEELNARASVSFEEGVKLDQFKSTAIELGVWR